MNSINIATASQKLLERMHKLAEHNSVQSANSAADFKKALLNGLQEVNNAQIKSEEDAVRVSLGDENIDISDAMISMSKAKVMFEGAVQVRNRLINAYETIMNMPI